MVLAIYSTDTSCAHIRAREQDIRHIQWRSQKFGKGVSEISVGENLSDLKKIGYEQEFFVRILNPDINSFIFLLSEPDFDQNLPSFELSDPKKIGYRTSIFHPNFDIVRIVRPEPEFLPALSKMIIYIINNNHKIQVHKYLKKITL